MRVSVHLKFHRNLQFAKESFVAFMATITMKLRRSSKQQSASRREAVEIYKRNRAQFIRQASLEKLELQQIKEEEEAQHGKSFLGDLRQFLKLHSFGYYLSDLREECEVFTVSKLARQHIYTLETRTGMSEESARELLHKASEYLKMNVVADSLCRGNYVYEI